MCKCGDVEMWKCREHRRLVRILSKIITADPIWGYIFKLPHFQIFKLTNLPTASLPVTALEGRG